MITDFYKTKARTIQMLHFLCRTEIDLVYAVIQILIRARSFIHKYTQAKIIGTLQPHRIYHQYFPLQGLVH